MANCSVTTVLGACRYDSEQVQWATDALGQLIESQRALKSAMLALPASTAEEKEVALTELRTAVASAQSLRANSAEGTELLAKAEVLCDLVEARSVQDWDAMQRTVERAGRLDMSHPEVSDVMFRLDRHDQIRRCEEQLHSAIQSVDQRKLHKSLQEAYRLQLGEVQPKDGVDAVEAARVAKEAEALVAKIDQITKTVGESMRSTTVNLLKVDDAVSEAGAIALESEDISALAERAAAIRNANTQLQKYVSQDQANQWHDGVPDLSLVKFKELESAVQQAEWLPANSMEGHKLLKDARIIVDIRRSLLVADWQSVDTFIQVPKPHTHIPQPPFLCHLSLSWHDCRIR